MPELPEVEVARRALEEHCVGKKIVICSVDDDPKVIDSVSPTDLQSALVGKTITAALRKGKNLWLRLDSPPVPTFQFGMAGAIYIKGIDIAKYKRSAVKTTDEEWPPKYSKVSAQLDDGTEFCFTDKRRFARVRLVHDPEAVPPISELGPDALNEPMKVDEFANALRQKKTPIKTLLLDQSFISGIGNWIADEVLYQARIHPMEKASDLSKENCETILECIKEVIDKALEVGADSSQYPDGWIVRYREKKPGKAFIEGRKIDFITAGGRTTAFVPELQKLSSSSKVVPSKSHKSKSDAGNAKETEENSESDKDDDSSRDAKRKPKKSEDNDSSRGAKREPKKSEDDDVSAGAKRKPKKSEDDDVSAGAKRKPKKSEDDDVSAGAKRKTKKSEDDDVSTGAKRKPKKSEDDDSSRGAKTKPKKSQDNDTREKSSSRTTATKKPVAPAKKKARK